MDIKDVSNESKYIGYLKQLQGAAERAARRKGQAVQDHPPSQQLVSSFLVKLMATSYRSQLNENTIATTQVPAPYPPCIVSANDLEPIMISDMRLETHHRGKKIMLRVLTPPDRMTAMMVIMEDKKGIAVLLQLYHQPEETIFPATEILSANMVCILKEPFFKCATDGTYSLRVNHPSNIIRLDGADNRIPSHWRPSMVVSDENSADIQKQGNDAIQLLKRGRTFEERQLAFLNRSFANLNLDRPKQALLDAEKATNPTMPSEKSLFRKAQALYELGEYQQSLEMLEKLTKSFTENKAASSEKDRINKRLKEQRTGEYKFKEIYKQEEKSLPFIDYATFSAPVEIRESPGRGKGLFTTKAVSAGELLLCEKAFSYSFAGDKQSTKQTKILIQEDGSNCRRSFIGDMQIVRATRDLIADTELFFYYRLPIPFKSYQEAQKGFKNWGFTCDCGLCLCKKATSRSVFQRRKVLADGLKSLLEHPGSGNGVKISRLVKALEETYPTNNDYAIRLEL
ncbi:hypothetical protein KAF25_002002 [Fusarium avenaceum]|uniref:SET domain-containing protein n=1 Tax=Fusarium avenaceum TaxID=40199 RepID=A0A9P7GSK5_9HYPO|nr:hypothetical protein KAF25_002002 [Fusarium avenaceum]